MKAAKLLLSFSLVLFACRPSASPSSSSNVTGNIVGTCHFISSKSIAALPTGSRASVFTALRQQSQQWTCPSITDIYAKTQGALRTACSNSKDCGPCDPLDNQEIAQIIKNATAPVLDDQAYIMHIRKSGSKGSIAGGFFEGQDGLVRYVKTPDDGLQSVSEHLANTLYADLGLPAAKSRIFLATSNGKRKIYYASEKLNFKSDIHDGIDKARARQFLRGFVADVLLANRDIVSSYGNTALDPKGQVIRIDSGSALMMRAVAGRKASDDFYKLREWTGLKDPGINPAYASIFKIAAYSKDELCKELKRQITAIDNFSHEKRSWSTYVNQVVPAFEAFFPNEFKTSVEMLTERQRSLKVQINRDCGPPAEGSPSAPHRPQ